MENHRTRYDSIALTLAIVPLIVWFCTIITAPVAVYFAIRSWKAPQSILGRSRIRPIAALLLAGLQITGWVFWIVS